MSQISLINNEQNEALTQLGHLARYAVKGLFDHRDYSFAIDGDEPTILTGANGTGKSTILRTIDAVGSARWADLHRIPFKRLLLHFDTGADLRVTRKEDSLLVELDGKAWT